MKQLGILLFVLTSSLWAEKRMEYGGMYTADVRASGGSLYCHSKNPMTQTCSCAPGYTAQKVNSLNYSTQEGNYEVWYTRTEHACYRIEEKR